MHKKLMALACAALISIGATGVSASANEVEETSGSYTYGVDEVSPVTRVEQIEYVGGGTWKHDSHILDQKKRCFSRYHHPTKKHSAYAEVGPSKQTVVKKAGLYANASAQAKYGYTAKAKWSNNVK